MNPKHLRLPSQNWPPVRRAHVLCERDKLFRLFAKWDSVGSLRLLDADHSETKYRCALFAVYQNHEKDRQILNPIPENGRTMNISDSTLSLSHGSLLTGLFLDDNQDLVFGADDLEDFYHCFIVTAEHAHRNHIHGVFDAERFVGWNCWGESLKGKKVVGCFSTLAMGTGFAVEVAQHVHSDLLKRKGCLNDDQWAQYRRPLPRGDVLQLLCIDDYAVLQKVPRGLGLRKTSGVDTVHREDLRLLNRANKAYSNVGLRSSEKKAVRDSFHTTILGGELDGRRGLVNAPRLRVLVLCKITLRLIQIGFCTKPLLETIVGCWIFILMFRMPLLCVLSDVFHEGEDIIRGEIFKLSTGCIQNLLLVVIFAPYAFTNLRAKPLPTVFCTDASLSGGGVCSADISKEASLELCRSSEQRGFYTRVNGSTLGTHEALHGHVIAGENYSGIPKSLTEGFILGFLRSLRGSGHLSAAHQSLGLRVHPGFEIRDGVEGDITNPATILALVGLIGRRVVKCFHIAMVCTTFGTLRRPRLRSKLEPFGFQPDQPDTAEGSRFAIRGGFVCFLCLYYGLIFSAEQPGGSVMYRLDLFQRLIVRGVISVRFPFCSWGTPFQKMSWWLSNSVSLQQLSDQCRCGFAGRHFRVQGTFARARLKSFKSSRRPSCKVVFGKDPELNQHVAKFSGGYPIPLCDQIARLNLQCLEQMFAGGEKETARPFSTPPAWIGQLGRCLPWKKLLQYEFKRLNHINVNENLAYRSLRKYVGKTSPSSRFPVFLDSRVTMGCNAKGCSSSKQPNFYPSTSLPYVLGGDLYPHLLHQGTHDNVSDDISRFVALRKPSEPIPPWFVDLQNGDFRKFDVVKLADSLVWPLCGWARLIGLALLTSSSSGKTKQC